MVRGSFLTAEEKGEIRGLARGGFSEREIALMMRRSRGAVRDALHKTNTDEPRRPRPPPVLSERDVRRLVRLAAQGNHTAGQLKRELELECSARTVQRVLDRVDFLVYTKMDCTLDLTPEHRARRLEWAKIYVTMGEEWENTVFSDEKKFNFDGPDGYKYYYRDTRRPPRTYVRQQMGGGSIMAWGAISMSGRSELVILVGRQNSACYIETMKTGLLTFAAKHHPDGYIYQQDNAKVHVSHETKTFFRDQGIPLLNWPARSPDLNPIDNVWAMMSRVVYANGKQYDTVDELRAAIFKAWAEIPQAKIAECIASMTSRVVEVLEKKGGKTSY
jgi:transposase